MRDIQEDRQEDRPYSLEGDLNALPLALSEEFLHFARTSASLFGLFRLGANNCPILAPLKVLPTPFKRGLFERLKSVHADNASRILSQLVRNKKLLLSIFENCCDTDGFVTNLLSIYRDTELDDYVFDLYRHDFIEESLVESNSVSVSLLHLGAGVQDWQRSTITRMKNDDLLPPMNYMDMMPQSNPNTKLAKSIVTAVHSRSSDCNEEKIVLFILKEEENNLVDITALIVELNKNGCKTVVKTLENVYASFKEGDLVHLTTKEYKKPSFMYGNLLIDMVYWRSFYKPEHIKDGYWNLRSFIEKTNSIKVPTVGLQIAASKRVQCFLSQGERVSLNFASDITKDQLRLYNETAVEQYTIHRGNIMEDRIQAVIAKALHDPSDWVVKRESEGGGNNLFDEELRDELEGIKGGKEEFPTYILMRKIYPNMTRGAYIRSGGEYVITGVEGEAPQSSVEVGFYTVLEGNNSVYSVEYLGYLARSKLQSSNECGIGSGNGFIDGLILI